jgi:hypothetical protein
MGGVLSCRYRVCRAGDEPNGVEAYSGSFGFQNGNRGKHILYSPNPNPETQKLKRKALKGNP